MPSTLRSLVIGLFTGLLLAVLLQQTLPPRSLSDLSSPHLESDALPSTWTLPKPVQFAETMLRNSLAIARQAARAAGGYKNRQPASKIFTSQYKASSFSTSPAAMATQKSFLQALKDRRTIYQLNKEAPISDKQIVSIARDAVLHVPSAFNTQTARLVVLLNAEHDKFWDAALEILKTIVPEDQFASTKGRIDGFRAGYGTILFFEDPEPFHVLEKQVPIFAHHFPAWAEHTSAMHQYALWVALEAEGFGASLQHYNPIVDQKVQSEWNVPQEWLLRAQLVFGGKAGEAGEKTYKDVENRLFVHGAKE